MSTTATAHSVAVEAAKYFTTGKRSNGDDYTHTTDDAPDWMRDMCHEAHGDMFPDDFKYDMISGAVDAIAEAGEDDDLGELQGEYADGAVDVYNSERTRWLASNLNRAGYVEDAQREFGGTDRNGEFDLFAAIGQGWYMEASEVFGYVQGALEAEAERRNEDNDEEAVA